MVVEPDGIAAVRQYVIFQDFDLACDPERACALRAPVRARAAHRFPPHGLQPCAEKEHHDSCSLKRAVCVIIRPVTHPARRPSAGAVPARFGRLLGGKTSPAALFLSAIQGP
jgi:hypothetical protein